MRITVFLALLAMCVLVPTERVSAQMDEKAMALDIGNQLKESGQLRDYRVGVKYHEGTAFLSGSVTSPQQRATATHLVQGMPGVNHVENNLSIAGGTAAGSSSSGRTTEIGGSLRQASQQSAGYNRPNVNQAYMMRPANQGPMGQGPMGPPQGSMGPPQGPMGPPQASMGPRMPQGRGNMPMPMRTMQPPIQQVSMMQDSNVQQAHLFHHGAGGPGGPGCASCGPGGGGMGGPMGGPMGGGPMGGGGGGYAGGYGGGGYENPQMPGYAWPSYASYPNYAAITYPKQYSPTAWPYIGPFYPYPQVPLGWRKVCLEWDDGWWFLDFSDAGANH